MVADLRFQYPGDPVFPVEVMNREEFLAAYPREPVTITSYDQHGIAHVESIPVGENEIVCDLCSEDPQDTIYVVRGSRAYCQKCAEISILPHVIGEG